MESTSGDWKSAESCDSKIGSSVVVAEREEGNAEIASPNDLST